MNSRNNQLAISWSLRQLQIVAATAELGNIRQAAASVGMSQPAASQAISKLENELGERLFRRDVHGTRPTESGLAFARRINRALSYFFDAQHKAVAAGEISKRSAANHRLATTRQFSIFLEMVEQRNYTQTARYLGVSQPNVHRAIRDLEKFLGQKLFHSYNGGLELTSTARLLAPDISLGFREIQQSFDELFERRGKHQSTIIIGCLPHVQTELIPIAISRIISNYPNVKIKIVDEEFAFLLDRLIRAKVDVVFGALRNPIPNENLIQETLIFDRLSGVVRASHPILKRDKDISLQTLDWIVPPERTPARVQFENYLSDNGTAFPTRFLECGSIAATRGLLENTNFAALLSISRIGSDLKENRLALLPVQHEPDPIPIGLCYRRSWHPTAVQAEMLQLLREVSEEFV
ncbi:MAG: LysR family transcriptional regulator [Sphingobium sp.]